MDTSVFVFFLYPVQAPRCSLLLLLELCAPLTTVNAQLVLDCRTGPLSLGFLPSASLCFWVDVTYALVLKGLKPQGARSELVPKCSWTLCYSRPAIDVAGWHSGTAFIRVSLCSRVQSDACKTWRKVGSHPIINTCGAENESCFQSELNLFSCSLVISLLLFTWRQRDLREALSVL